MRVNIHADFVSRFQKTWPAAEIPVAEYFAEFDADGDLVDTNVPEGTYGESVALIDDAVLLELGIPIDYMTA